MVRRLLKMVGPCLLLVLLIFCVVRVWTQDRWSGWAFGDAQTLLATRHWVNDGFRSTHFLVVPQGYSSIAKYLDEKELSHHAHGIFPPTGAKRIYTHYPSWYAFPYGILAKLGIDKKAVYQSLALLLSWVGLLFFYLFLVKHFSSAVSSGTVALYALSEGFLSYCDSLANMPFDDLLRFSFVYLWAHHCRKSTGSLPYLCGVLYFFSCLTSFDSILWIFLFAASYSLFVTKNFAAKAVLFLGLVSLLAIFVQFMQNTSYLGLGGALPDWLYQFGLYNPIARNTHGSDFLGVTLIKNVHFYLYKFFDMKLPRLFFLCLAVGMLADRNRFRIGAILGTFFAAGVSFVFVFPSKAIEMGYQERLMAPFIFLLIAILAEQVVQSFVLLLRLRHRWAAIRFSCVFVAIFLGLHLPLHKYFSGIGKRLAVRSSEVQPLKAFLGKVGVRGKREPILFSLKSRGVPLEIIRESSLGNQVSPIYEYYANTTILGVNGVEIFAKDARLLRERAGKDMAILLLVTPDDLREASAYLNNEGLRLTKVGEIEGRLIAFDVGFGSPKTRTMIE